MQVHMQNKDEEPKLSRKEELELKKKRRGDLPKAEERELREILAEEEKERRRGALIHDLKERSDKHYRTKHREVTRETTDKVQLLKLEETAKKQDLAQSFNDKRAEAKKVAESAIKEIREELAVTLESLRQSQTQQTSDITEAFRPRYEELEATYKLILTEVEDTVTYFKQIAEALPIEKLEKLARGDAVEVEWEGDGETDKEYLVCPGTE